MEFKPFPKIPRLQREIVVTEKLDGTNASILIAPRPAILYPETVAHTEEFVLLAGSRTRWLNCSSSGDNYGFAKWVRDNAQDLLKLGVGHHFGEWWGRGIQRNYGLTERRFSLFNVEKWNDPTVRPSCTHVVPSLYKGPFYTSSIEAVVSTMRKLGSLAVPGYMKPEGIIIYHTAGNLLFKRTLEDDDAPKTAARSVSLPRANDQVVYAPRGADQRSAPVGSNHEQGATDPLARSA